MFLLVPTYPGNPGPKAVKRLCVYVCARIRLVAFLKVSFVFLCVLC